MSLPSSAVYPVVYAPAPTRRINLSPGSAGAIATKAMAKPTSTLNASANMSAVGVSGSDSSGSCGTSVAVTPLQQCTTLCRLLQRISPNHVLGVHRSLSRHVLDGQAFKLQYDDHAAPSPLPDTVVESTIDLLNECRDREPVLTAIAGCLRQVFDAASAVNHTASAFHRPAQPQSQWSTPSPQGMPLQQPTYRLFDQHPQSAYAQAQPHSQPHSQLQSQGQVNSFQSSPQHLQSGFAGSVVNWSQSSPQTPSTNPNSPSLAGSTGPTNTPYGSLPSSPPKHASPTGTGVGFGVGVIGDNKSKTGSPTNTSAPPSALAFSGRLFDFVGSRAGEQPVPVPGVYHEQDFAKAAAAARSVQLKPVFPLSVSTAAAATTLAAAAVVEQLQGHSPPHEPKEKKQKPTLALVRHHSDPLAESGVASMSRSGSGSLVLPPSAMPSNTRGQTLVMSMNADRLSANAAAGQSSSVGDGVQSPVLQMKLSVGGAHTPSPSAGSHYVIPHHRHSAAVAVSAAAPAATVEVDEKLLTAHACAVASGFRRVCYRHTQPTTATSPSSMASPSPSHSPINSHGKPSKFAYDSKSKGTINAGTGVTAPDVYVSVLKREYSPAQHSLASEVLGSSLVSDAREALEAVDLWATRACDTEWAIPKVANAAQLHNSHNAARAPTHQQTQTCDKGIACSDRQCVRMHVVPCPSQNHHHKLTADCVVGADRAIGASAASYGGRKSKLLFHAICAHYLMSVLNDALAGRYKPVGWEQKQKQKFAGRCPRGDACSYRHFAELHDLTSAQLWCAALQKYTTCKPLTRLSALTPALWANTPSTCADGATTHITANGSPFITAGSGMSQGQSQYEFAASAGTIATVTGHGHSHGHVSPQYKPKGGGAGEKRSRANRDR